MTGRWAAVALAIVAACEPAPAPAVYVDGELWLSGVGLYRDIARREIAAGWREFEPAYPLWSDGLAKRRWLRLPAGARIDSSDMDHWQFPVGTMLAKEFSAGDQPLETRIIVRTGDGRDDFWLGAFAWNDDGTDARFVPGGARRGDHEVPSARQCWACHLGEPGRVLGLSAVQGADLPAGWLTDPVPPFAPPGDPVTAAALGTLHASCGHCHNPHGIARPDTDMDLSLSIGDGRVEDTGAFRTAIDRRAQALPGQRIARGRPDDSLVLTRMSARGTPAQMPPLGTDQVDRAAVALIRAWIRVL